MSNREWMFGLVSVMSGCCSNVVFLELLVKECPDSGHLITFTQFLCVALSALFENLEWTSGGLLMVPRLKKRTAPLWQWLQIVVIFFVVNLLNNAVFQYRISMPFHIIFRSASLFVSMLLGYFFLRRSYSPQQILGVILVTVGVIVCTLSAAAAQAQVQAQGGSNTTTSPNETTAAISSSSNSSGGSGHEHEASSELSELWVWLHGMFLLVTALVLSCFLGMKQEYVYRKYGKISEEGLFYVHGLSLPAFAFFYKEIWAQVGLFNASPPFELLGTALDLWGFTLPRLWVYLALNVISQ